MQDTGRRRCMDSTGRHQRGRPELHYCGRMFSRINLWLSSLVVLPPPLPLNIHDDDRRCSLSSDWLRKYAHASCSILYQLCCGSVNCVRMKKYNYNYISERLSLLLLLHFLNGQITTILVWARRRHGTLYPADLRVFCVLPTPLQIELRI